MAAKKLGISADEYIAKINQNLKHCYACKTWVDLSLFGNDKSRYDGKTAKCKSCLSKHSSDSPSKIERDEKLENGLKWCRACRMWLSAEKVKSGVCQFHANEEYRRHYAKSESFRREIRHRNYARKRNIAPIPAIGQEYLLETFENKCAYCDADATTFDHIIAISKGGKTTPDNIVPACLSCNSSKNNSDVWEWLERTNKQPREQFYERIHLGNTWTF